MDYYHLRTAKTLDELVKLIDQSDIPFDVRQHVCNLLDNELDHSSDEVITTFSNELEDLMAAMLSLCSGLIEAKGSKEQLSKAFTDFETSFLGNADLQTDYTSEHARGFIDELRAKFK